MAFSPTRLATTGVLWRRGCNPRRPATLEALWRRRFSPTRLATIAEPWGFDLQQVLTEVGRTLLATEWTLLTKNTAAVPKLNWESHRGDRKFAIPDQPVPVRRDVFTTAVLDRDGFYSGARPWCVPAKRGVEKRGWGQTTNDQLQDRGQRKVQCLFKERAVNDSLAVTWQCGYVGHWWL